MRFEFLRIRFGVIPFLGSAKRLVSNIRRGMNSRIGASKTLFPWFGAASRV